MRLTRMLVSAMAALLPALAQAELDCVVPTREMGFEPGRPGAAALRRAAWAAEKIVQKNAVFMAGNQPVRVRTTISYGGWDYLSVSIITTAYNRKAWLAGGCKVSKNADRGGGLSDGTLAVFINDPDSLLGGPIGDAQLDARLGPKLLGRKAEFPIYGAGGNEQSPLLLMTRRDYLPFRLVTVGEMLDWHERELQQQERAYQVSLQRDGGDFDEAKIEEMALEMKKIDAAQAEKTRAQLLAALKKSRARQARDADATARVMTGQRSAFDAYRASLTPAQRAAPGTLGGTPPRGGGVRVDDPSGNPVARIDPDYRRRKPSGIHVITVSLAAQPKTDPQYDWHQASLEALDLAALAGLLDP